MNLRAMVAGVFVLVAGFASAQSGDDPEIAGKFLAARSAGDVACNVDADCESSNPCIRAICDSGSGTCANHPRWYGDANHDGEKNIIDVACVARVAFQDSIACGLPEELDYGPNDLACGDNNLNIVDVVACARAVFQDADDICCGTTSIQDCCEVTGDAPHCFGCDL